MIKNLKTYNVSATQITIIVKIFVLLIIVNSQSIISKKNYTSIDLWKDISYKTNNADVYVHPNHKVHFVGFLEKLKIGYYVKIGDLGKVIDEEEKELGKRRIFQSGDHPSLMTINEYHNLDEIESYIDSLGNNFDTVKTIIIGTSYEKRLIRGVIITEKNDKIKKKVLINGCIHAREWLSCATMIYIMNELTNNSKKYEQLLSTTEVHVIPVINTDGYAYSWDHDRLWRKTRSGPHNGCYGVDPNRNFDFKWRFSGYSTDPCDETYAGESPFSEPESKALGAYIKNAFDNGHPFSVYFDIHTYSENFIYPYGYDHVYPSNVNDLRDISNKATQAIYSIHQSNFNFGSICDIVYPASGSTIDYATSIGSIKHAFAMELRPNEYVNNGFILPSSQIIDGASEAWEGIYVVFNKSCVLYYNVYTVNPKAATPIGFYEGFEYKDAYVYLGIRYAAPPVGERRFEKPVVVERHEDVYDATKFGNACPPSHRHEQMYTKQNISEDCLFLNIMTPKAEPKSKEGYPVLVYIHGGGFSLGDSAYLGYENLVENFVSRGIVVVTIQYRLGFLGFGTTGDYVLPGNIGLWDQTYALYFIDGIITSFRGNRDDITISGTSAGSASVGALTISPHSNFMFKRTVQFSGSIFNEFGLTEQSEIFSKRLFEHAGCSHKDNLEVLKCMKSKSLEELYTAMDKVGIHCNTFTDFMFTPRLDDDFFPGKLETLIKAADKKPSMIGIAEKEFSFFLFNNFNKSFNIDRETIENFDKKSLESYIATIVLPYDETGRNGGAFRHHLFNFVVDKYPPPEGASKIEIRQHYLEKLIEMVSDISINIGVYHEMQIKLYNDWPIYFFLMEHYNEYLQRDYLVKGATHCAESAYLFNIDHIPEDKYTKEDENFEESLSMSITNFIKTGDPSLKNIKWGKLTKENPSKYLSFDGKGNKIVSEYNSERINFYVKELPNIVGTGILSKTRIPSAEIHRIHTEL